MSIQIFHRSKKHLEENKITKLCNYKEENEPDIVVDFMQTPRLFLRKKLADVVESLNIRGIERVKNSRKNEEDAFGWVDCGDSDKIKPLEIAFTEFHIFNKADIIDEEKTTWKDENVKYGFESIENLVIDQKKLAEVLQNEKLIFTLEQDASYLFIEDSIINNILDRNIKEVWVRWGEPNISEEKSKDITEEIEEKVTENEVIAYDENNEFMKNLDGDIEWLFKKLISEFGTDKQMDELNLWIAPWHGQVEVQVAFDGMKLVENYTFLDSIGSIVYNGDYGDEAGYYDDDGNILETAEIVEEVVNYFKTDRFRERLSKMNITSSFSMYFQDGDGGNEHNLDF